MLQKLKFNFLYVYVGLTAVLKGLAFMVAHHFFTWPPQFAWILNDIRIDALAIIIGFCLVVYALSNFHSRRIQGILLGGCTAFFCFITILEICHVIFVKQLTLLPNIAGNIPLIALVLFIAKTQHKR